MQKETVVSEISLGRFVTAKVTKRESINGITRIVFREGEKVFLQGMYYPGPNECPEIMLGVIDGNVESVSVLELENLVHLRSLH